MWQVYFGDNLSIGIEFNPPSLRFRASSYGVEGCSRLRKITLTVPAKSTSPCGWRHPSCWWRMVAVPCHSPFGASRGSSSLTVRSILLYLDAKVLQKTEKIAETERIFSFLLLKEAYNYIISVVNI